MGPRAAKRADREHQLEEDKQVREELDATRAPERLSSAAQDAMRSFKVTVQSLNATHVLIWCFRVMVVRGTLINPGPTSDAILSCHMCRSRHARATCATWALHRTLWSALPAKHVAMRSSRPPRSLTVRHRVDSVKLMSLLTLVVASDACRPDTADHDGPGAKLYPQEPAARTCVSCILLPNQPRQQRIPLLEQVVERLAMTA